MRKNRRFRVLNIQFQAKLVGRFFVYWVIYQFTMWNFLFCWQLLSEGRGNPVEQYSRFFHSHYSMLLCFATLVPFFVWDVAKFSNRVAGPIVRFRQTIRSITAGEPIRLVRLRADDHLTDIADDLNKMIQALEDRGAVTIDRSAVSSDSLKPEPAKQLEAVEATARDDSFIPHTA